VGLQQRKTDDCIPTGNQSGGHKPEVGMTDAGMLHVDLPSHLLIDKHLNT
jgi:hypothetical protein